ncbi:MAG TPA: hypothetical protein DHV62_00340 [Elusimicrobia bacterium]|jgi:hypothetical protein|nr:hypothetical protein [Elusimicrobiota bacterium]
MENKVAKNQKDVEKYRRKIFKEKEYCHRIFARESFEKKIKTAFDLYRNAEYLKKFKPTKAE